MVSFVLELAIDCLVGWTWNNLFIPLAWEAADEVAYPIVYLSSFIGEDIVDEPRESYYRFLSGG